MTIAERVKLRRAELSLTQAELAVLAKTSQQAIQQLVDGKLYAIAQPGAGEEKLKRIKQLYRKPGGILIIRSFNREDEEAMEQDVEIIGRVFWYSVLL